MVAPLRPIADIPFRVNSRVLEEDGFLVIETDYMGSVMRQIANLQDQQVRDILIRLGWTPPPTPREPQEGSGATAPPPGPLGALRDTSPGPGAIRLHTWGRDRGGYSETLRLEYHADKAPVPYRMTENSPGGGELHTYSCGSLLKALAFAERWEEYLC